MWDLLVRGANLPDGSRASTLASETGALRPWALRYRETLVG